MGKQYANYRFGGKTERSSDKTEEIKITSTNKHARIAEIFPVINPDTFELQIATNNIVEDKRSFAHNREKSGEYVIKKEGVKINFPDINLSSLIPKRKSAAFIFKKRDFGSELENVLEWIGAIAGLILITILVIVYLQSVNFAIIDVILILAVIAVAILICIGIGKLFEAIMPGMNL